MGVTGVGLEIDGEHIALISGEVHYWRLDPKRWPAILDAVVGLGFGCISTYVPWARHEIEPGVVDTSGSLDLAAFLTLAHDRGLKAVVRVGPDTACEQEDSGWPRRVLDDPQCQARRANGQPYVLVSSTGHCFPPSYASTKVLAAVGEWYDAIAPVIAPLLAPGGPVVAVQVDNEIGFHFQGHSYALDHHPDFVREYRAFVGDPTATAPTDATSGTEQERLAWIEFREEHLRRTLATFVQMLRDRGIEGVPFVHNDYPRTATPIDTGALERSGAVDIAGADIYAPRQGSAFVRDLCRRLVGSTRLPYLAELGAGWLTLPWLLPLSVDAIDEEAIAVRVLTSGVRATNVYMLVERDRWWGSPISADGELRPSASLYPRLFSLLERSDIRSMRRDARVLVVDNRTEARRVAARDTLGGVVPSFTQLLPIDHRLTQLPHPDSDELRRWDVGLAAAVVACGADFDRASSDAMPDLTAYDVVLMPTLDALAPQAWDALTRAAAAGVVVAVGPRVPTLDARARRVAAAARQLGAIRLLCDPADAAALVPAPLVACDRDDVVVTVWEGEGRRVVVAAHDGEGDVVAHLRTSAPRPGQRWVGLWHDENLLADTTGAVVATLGPWDVQVWEVAG